MNVSSEQLSGRPVPVLRRPACCAILWFPVWFLFLFGSPICSFAKMRTFSNVSPSNFPAGLIPHIAEHPVHEGFLDVTKAPYCAAGDGVTDDTDAIQAAIDDAYDSNLVVFFPGDRVYLCSRQLLCVQEPLGTVPDSSQRKFSHKLRGSAAGAAPVLKVKDNSALSDNIFLVFKYQTAEGDSDASRHYCAEFRGIDIDMGSNPDASALRMNGAQYCVIDQVEIYGSDFNIGLNGLPGSGGGVSNVKITGGKIGVYQNQYRPNPSIAGLRLIGQSQCGIKTEVIRGPLVVAGFEIESPLNPDSSYRAVYACSVFISEEIDPSVGNLLMVDGSILVHGASGSAVYAHDQDVYMEEVWISADTLIESGLRNPPAEILSGSGPGRWDRIAMYSFATGSDRSWLVRDGNIGAAAADTVQFRIETDIPEPEEDFTGLHLPPSGIPDWESHWKADITAAPFGATADNALDDDAPAIQSALNAVVDPLRPNWYGKPVFMPRGHFHIRSPIIVPAGAELFGAADTISVLHVDPAWILDSPQSVLTTEGGAEARVLLADFAILGHDPTPVKQTETQRLLRYVTVNTGKTVWQNVQLTRREWYQADNNYLTEPIVLIGENGGGRFYNLCDDTIPRPAAGFPGPDFHILSIQGSSSPLQFYHSSIEHLKSGPAQIALNGARNVSFFGLKYETNHRLMDIVNSRHVRIYGGSGNYGLVQPEDTSIILVTNSFDVRMACISRKPLVDELAGKDWIEWPGGRVSDDYSIALFTLDEDYDLDELPDSWEMLYAADLAGIGAAGPESFSVDTDADGAGDYHEYIAGTSPLNSADFLRITHGKDGRISWYGQAQRTYRLKWSADLLSDWHDLDEISGDGSLITIDAQSLLQETTGSVFFLLHVYK